MNCKSIFAIVVAGIVCAVDMIAQTSIDRCVELAYDNYPQIKEFQLIDATEKYDVSNAGIGWAPQVTLSGKATWQSDVVEMPFDLMGYSFDIPHDQYSIVADVTQPLWDGGVNASRKRLAEAGAEVKRKQLDVNLYSIKSRVRNVCLGILLIDRQLEINAVLEENLGRSAEEVKSLIDNGVACASDLDQVKVNILSCRQQKASLECDRKSYIKVLSLLTGVDMTGVEIEEPSTDLPVMSIDTATFARPEMALYSAQLKQAQLQLKQLNTAISPKFNLTLQGGYARPGLNMLSGKFSPYFVAGIKMQWNFGALYTLGNDRRKAEADIERVDLSRKSFILNTSVEAEQKRNEIEKARDVLEQDASIIELRGNIRRTGETQYREGTLKMNDYLGMVDEEFKARINESIHKVQLIMAIYDYRDTIGE